MTSLDPSPAAPPPSPRLQFSLRTLLLLFVVDALDHGHVPTGYGLGAGVG